MSILALLAILSGPVQDEKDPNLESLRAVWKTILDQANADKVDDIKATLTAMKITKEEFTTLFGEEKTKLAYEKYEKFWKDLEQEAAADIVKRVKENKYDNVQVWRVDGSDPKSISGNEKNVLDSLTNKETKVYSLRLVTGNDTKGFTLVCFFKVGDNWRAGFKVGRMLAAK